MRDIVIANYNQAPKSGTLNKTDYKSYKDFLENYSDNKNSKDDVESVSSTDSGVSSYRLLESKSNNTSTSSLNSDVNGTANKTFSKVEPTRPGVMGGRTGSFRNYMENYNHKKFNSVKPVIATKPNVIKSEIVIQVNDPLDAQPKIAPKIEKVFIQRSNSLQLQECLSPASSPEHQECFTTSRSPPPPPPLPPVIQQINCAAPPPPPPPPMPLGCNNAKQGKKWATVETENVRSNSSEQPNIPKSNTAAASLAKILNEHFLARRKLSDTESPSTSSPHENKTVPTTPYGNLTKASTLPRTERKVVIPEALLQKQSLSPPKVSRVTSPKPPRAQNSTSPKTNGLISNVDTVDYCTTTVVPVSDGTKAVNKGDPNVKKLVYNTYRGLLGAYNNKANDMISTLPRNMVREDKGVAKQVESISLQCRLEKLNGRINPKLEQE